MSPDCFARNVQRLRDAFGDKGYSEVRMKMVLHRLSIVSDEEFAYLCDEIIAEYDRFPKMSIFMKLALPYIEKRKLAEFERKSKTLASKKRCDACDSKGMITAFLKNRPHAGAFGAGCPEKCDFWQVMYPALAPIAPDRRPMFVIYDANRHTHPHDAWCQANQKGTYSPNPEVVPKIKAEVEKWIQKSNDYLDKQDEDFVPPF